MKGIKADGKLVAYCGLYCGACKKYLADKCPGCHKNEKASWCKVRKCCLENNLSSCAECKDYSDVMDCKYFNNFMSKLFGFALNSDRNKCVKRIKEIGVDQFAREMAAKKLVTLKRK